MIKKFIILFFVLVSFSSVFSQGKFNKKNANLPYFENSKFHFGFSLGGNSGSFKVKYDLTTMDSLISLQTSSQGGFNIGFLGSMRINDYFTVRFLPTLAFTQRNFNYIFESSPRNNAQTRIVESVYVMFPLLMKYRSARYNNFAAYVIGGPNFAWDLASKHDVNNELVISEQVLKVKRQNIFAEIGFGTDFFLEYFKLSIELKYSHGLGNVFIDDGSYWAEPIQEITPKMFTISVHFEG
jgi:hypothetical protein